MAVDHPQNKAIVFDTDAYAGNFEREMCAFITGRYGDCGVGSDIAEVVLPELRHFYDWYKDKVTQEPDEHGCWRPASIWPSPALSGTVPQYNSVAIFVEEFPPEDVLVEMAARAQAFVNAPVTYEWGVRPGAILGMRTFEPSYRIEERGSYDVHELARRNLL
jgi:hypothetical protein